MCFLFLGLSLRHHILRKTLCLPDYVIAHCLCTCTTFEVHFRCPLKQTCPSCGSVSIQRKSGCFALQYVSLLASLPGPLPEHSKYLLNKRVSCIHFLFLKTCTAMPVSQKGLVGGAGIIARALRAAVSPDVLASAQGLVYIQSLSLYPKVTQAKGRRRVLS